MQTATPTIAPVVRRRVFYIPGFDPAPPRRYRELYRKESSVQAALSGYKIETAARHDKGGFGWSVAATIDGHDVATDIEVLVWSDIVRQSMGGGIVSTYGQLLRTVWIYGVSGALFRLARLRKGPVIAALYPVVVLLVELAFAGLVFWLAASLCAFGLARLSTAIYGPNLVAPWFSVLIYGATTACLMMAILVLRWFKRHDGHIFAYYLMHDYAFTAQHWGAYPPQLEMRLAEFRDLICTALQGGYDEVLVVGHSSGVHLAVSVLADVLRGGGGGPPLGFLSLGHVVPMVSFLPAAHKLRRDLNYLSGSDGIAWVDITAPGDGCAFALCDPVAVTGVATPGKRWPLVLSAAFTQTLSPEKWKSLRWRFFRLHFQYLCAFDRPGDYDYFRITAGPQTLAKRFAERSASKSRIEAPTSGFTGMAA